MDTATANLADRSIVKFMVVGTRLYYIREDVDGYTALYTTVKNGKPYGKRSYGAKGRFPTIDAAWEAMVSGKMADHIAGA